jgi:crossover junction endodeoxyribonuclease RusA
MICLPFPPRILHPNARPNVFAKAKAAKAYRAHAFYAAKASGVKKASKGVSAHVDITFHPPNRHKHDLDGLLSSIKNGLDGVSDAIGIDDSLWSITIKKGQPIKGGLVSITVTGVTHEQGSGSV